MGANEIRTPNRTAEDLREVYPLNDDSLRAQVELYPRAVQDLCGEAADQIESLQAQLAERDRELLIHRGREWSCGTCIHCGDKGEPCDQSASCLTGDYDQYRQWEWGNDGAVGTANLEDLTKEAGSNADN